MTARSSLLATAFALVASTVIASDHGEAPLVATSDPAADIADLYAFVDPTDATKVVLIMTAHGFILPGENANSGGFDSGVQYRFDVENTGDAGADTFVRVELTKQRARNEPQTASVTISDVVRFHLYGPTTVASGTASRAPAPIVTTDDASGVSVFAGIADDPFFYDRPAVSRFVGSALAGSADEGQLSRAKDTFAGTNVQVIAVRLPSKMLTGPAGSVIGVSATTLRRQDLKRSSSGDQVASGPFVPVDRVGVPAVATVLVPFARRDAYNRASTKDDAAGLFARDIVGTLKAVGTDDAHVAILAGVAVTRGDQLRLDTSPAAKPGFPNGRRLQDDVIDTILGLVTNGAIESGDGVDANDVPFRDTFPYVAAPHQPESAAHE